MSYIIPEVTYNIKLSSNEEKVSVNVSKILEKF